jgi:uncharacterized OB-fold protein
VSSIFKAVCPKCGTPEMSVLEETKAGTIIDFVLVSFPPENLKDMGEYTSVLVRLANGCQTFGIISNDPKDIKMGASVVVSSYNEETKALFFEVA